MSWRRKFGLWIAGEVEGDVIQLSGGGIWRRTVSHPVEWYDSSVGGIVTVLELKDDSGDMPNTITTAGIAAVASRINGDGSEAVFTTIALATSATAIVIGDTALTSEITTNGLGRGASTVSRTGTNNEKASFTKSWTATGSETIGSMGVLNNVTSGGTMLSANGGYSQAVVLDDVVNATYTVPLA